MMKLVDILGLGSSSFYKRVRVQVPFLVSVLKKNAYYKSTVS